MSYPMLAQFGLGIANSFLKAKSEAGMVKAQRVIDAANARAQNLLREGENEKRAAFNALANYTKSINNQRAMRAGGEQITAMSENFNRLLDASTKGALQSQVANAEELGRLSAQAAWSGVGGSTNEMIERTLRLRQAAQEHERTTAMGQRSYEFGKQRAQATRNLAEGLDYRYELAGMDYGINQAPYRATPDLFTAALSGADFSLLRDSFAKVPKQGQPQATGFKSFSTPVTSPNFAPAVSADFFQINPSGVGVKLI